MTATGGEVPLGAGPSTRSVSAATLWLMRVVSPQQAAEDTSSRLTSTHPLEVPVEEVTYVRDR